MENRGVDPATQRKVIREIEYLSKMEKDGHLDTQSAAIINKLSNGLKEEVLRSISF